MEPETWRNKAVYDVAALGDVAVSHWKLELYSADVAYPHWSGWRVDVPVLLVSIKAPHHFGVYQNQNQHLRCLCSPSSSRHRTSKTLHHLRPPSLRLASGCSSSHFTFGLFLARLRLLVVNARALSLFSVVFVRHCVSPPAARRRLRLRHFGLLIGLSTSPRTPVASLPRGARRVASPFSSPALPSPLSCFRHIIPPNPITTNETYASASQPLLRDMHVVRHLLGRISPKSRVKIPIVRGRGDRRGGRGVSRTMHQ
ncbi:hypothetical protein Syun_014144 [Stephania yunnanensis]|uniref:Uncharacterized protein n=1 Tax=Stephania yunnanensis TaxID=152371 RepID=A0AAP0P996_9MAGN